MPTWAMRKRCAGRKIALLEPRKRTSRSRPVESMAAFTCPYCRMQYSVRSKLLMRIELSRKQGNINAEIRPKFEASDTHTKWKWVEILLKIKGSVREPRLKPKKLPYQLPPITRLTPAGRLRTKKTTNGPTTKSDTASAETPRRDKPTPHGRLRRERKMRRLTPKTDYLQLPTRINRRGKRRRKRRQTDPRHINNRPTKRKRADNSRRKTRNIPPERDQSEEQEPNHDTAILNMTAPKITDRYATRRTERQASISPASSQIKEGHPDPPP